MHEQLCPLEPLLKRLELLAKQTRLPEERVVVLSLCARIRAAFGPPRPYREPVNGADRLVLAQAQGVEAALEANGLGEIGVQRVIDRVAELVHRLETLSGARLP